jgi:sodium-dependent dicarboxylate transporter 2/3/5
VGTPPNAALAAFAEQAFGRPIGFLAWMAVGVPVAVVLTALTWLILRIGFGGAPIAGAGERLRAAAAALGPWRPAERRVAAIALVTVLLWIGGPLLAGLAPGLGDSVVAVAAAVVLFLIPSGEGSGRLLGAADIARLPWGILLLVGGGLSLASAIEASGLAEWLGQALGGLAGLPPLAAVAVIVLATVLFSELASNTATATALLPVVAAIAAGIGVEPLTLAAPMALAASCGFMLPVATPPNAIAYATGKVSVGQMARAGFAVDAAGIAVVTLLGYTLVGLVFTG